MAMENQITIESWFGAPIKVGLDVYNELTFNGEDGTADFSLKRDDAIKLRDFLNSLTL